MGRELDTTALRIEGAERAVGVGVIIRRTLAHYWAGHPSLLGVGNNNQLSISLLRKTDNSNQLSTSLRQEADNSTQPPLSLLQKANNSSLTAASPPPACCRGQTTAANSARACKGSWELCVKYPGRVFCSEPTDNTDPACGRRGGYLAKGGGNQAHHLGGRRYKICLGEARRAVL